jgi:hypothetical protein
MLRGLILLLMGGAAIVIALPFVMTSRALDQRGITIPGRVYHKSETVRVHYSNWDPLREVTIEYTIPEINSVSFFNIKPDEQHYDAFHAGQPVEVRYLLHRDVPDLPLTPFLWSIRVLPTVRLKTGPDGGGINHAFTPDVILGVKILGGLAVLFVLWRITRWKPLAWAAGIGIAAGAGLLLLQGFPRPTPAPAVSVRRGVGQVASIQRIDKLFNGSRSRGIVAEQPIDVLAVQFVPDGRTEPVVAVDLIDRGSVAGLKQGSPVPVRYEAASPRTAWIEGATRTFPQRNLHGGVTELALSLGLMVAVLLVVHWIGQKFKRLVTVRRP